MTSLVVLGLLSILAPQVVEAQQHPRGTYGEFRFAPGAGGRARFGAPGFGGFGAREFGGRGYGAPFGAAPYGRAPYPPGGYSPYPYGGQRYSAPPPYGGYGADRARAFGGGDWRDQQNEVRQAVRDGRHIPLGRAIDAVRQRMPGRELDAGLEPGPDGRAVYRLRWAASNGRRIDYLVDAATGAIVSEQGGR